MAGRIEHAGNVVGGILILLAILAIPALFIIGAEWMSERLLPWFSVASILAFTLLVLVLLPLAAFRSSRSFASVGILIVSYIFGATVWMESLLLTMALWGTFAVVVGLFIVGIGVVPIAMLATLCHGMWARLGELVLLAVLSIGSRIFAFWVAEKVDSRDVIPKVGATYS